MIASMYSSTEPSSALIGERCGVLGGHGHVHVLQDQAVNVGQDDEEHGYAESAGKLGREM